MLGGLTSRFRVVTGIVGALVLLLGLLFIGAATAFAGHGPGMRVTVVLLWICVCCNVVGGAATIVAAFLPRRDRPAGS
jgi:hypothetical protein